MTSPHSQSQYQVRFDWGLPGACAVGEGVGLIVWVDELGGPPSAGTLPGELPTGPNVILGTISRSAAIARWALERQSAAGDRFTVAVIAAGEIRDDASLRFAVEDLLAAGAVIDALAAVGIDYCSPEAAAASAAFTGLRGATAHLITASASGRARGSATGPATVSSAPVDDLVFLRE